MEANLATPHPIFRFKDGTSRNTARISKAKWDEHKELLCSLYQEKTISEVLAFMQTEHAFVANAGQLGRKLREWGVYKYDSKNRPLNPELLPSDHRIVDGSFEEALPYTVSEDLPDPEDTAIHFTTVLDPPTAPDTGPYMRSYLGSAIQPSWSPDESLGFGEVLPEYAGGTLTDTRLVEPSGAATAASNHITASGSSTQVSSAQASRAHEEDAAAPIRVELPTPVELPTIMNEPDHGKLSDIDMDRLSAISITSSKTNSFLSLLSLAQRIRLGQTGGTSSGRDSVNDLPSSAIDWYRRSSSLYLFGCRSSTLSITSSQKTNSIRMSWKPEIPITIQEAEAEATQQIQIPPSLTQALQVHKPFCFACNEHFKNKGSLKRHQMERCEREKMATCLLCPPNQAIYYTKDRLIRHHVSLHGDKCQNGCSKKISVLCKEHLSNSFENLPPKKAWGCPYCINCFKTFEEWNGHCIEHLKRADKAPKWSFGTMIWSLLQQESLREALSYHDFAGLSNWSSLNEKTCSGLREVLEYCKLPSWFGGREYWYLSNNYAVVRCVCHYITTGQEFPSQHLFEVCSKPTPYHMPISTGENSDSVSGRGNTNRALQTSPFSQPPAENEIITSCSIQTTNFATQPFASVNVEIVGDVKSRSIGIQNEDDIGGRQTRRRGASLKRSLSNLALRPSSSKSPAIQTVAVPLPGDSKASNADKNGAGAHQDRNWPLPSYLDPIPQYRPMSGVVYDWSWPGVDQIEQ